MRRNAIIVAQIKIYNLWGHYGSDCQKSGIDDRTSNKLFLPTLSNHCCYPPLSSSTSKAAPRCESVQEQSAASTACQWYSRILFLSEDRDERGLKDSDLHQSTVWLHRLPVIKGNHKQLQRDIRMIYSWKRKHTIITTPNHTASLQLLFWSSCQVFLGDMFSILIKTWYQNLAKLIQGKCDCTDLHS